MLNRPTPGARPGKSPRGLALDQLPHADLDSNQLLRAAMHDLLVDRRQERRGRMLRLALYALAFALPALMYLGTWFRSGLPAWVPGADSVGVVRIDGEMSSGSAAGADQVVPALRRAFEARAVRAVVLAIDSPGGAPAEAERIFTALQALRVRYPKPVVAVIGGQGASAAYLVAIHCDRIYAGRYSLVGSIGALLTGWDAHELVERHGLRQRLYTSGPLKALMNPFVPMAESGERRARDLVGRIADTFGRDVAERRQLALTAELVSGTVWDGDAAKDLGLVDELATLDQVLASRWAGLPIRVFGASAGSSFGLASADWVGRAMARAVQALDSSWALR
ncbi:MAG: S49 family peptidase [Rubrivivax sp.]